MKGLVLSAVGLTGAVVFLAGGNEVGTKQVRPPVARESSPAAAQEKPAWYGGEMVLARAGDGHFYADAQVDTGSYQMLVDTGASVVALTAEDARDMGLDWDPNALAPVAQGASGPVMGVPATIPDMMVGDFEAHNVQAIIVPDGLPVSLLGQSFLRQVPNVAIAGDKLTLSN